MRVPKEESLLKLVFNFFVLRSRKLKIGIVLILFIIVLFIQLGIG